MHNDDTNMRVEIGTPIDPADFGRIRVAKILRSEKPLNEQEDASFMLHVQELVRMLGVPDNPSIIWFDDRLAIYANGIKRGHTCKIEVQTLPTVSYWVRKRGPGANLNSRFLPRPSHPR
jgi:hypothetical protein